MFQQHFNTIGSTQVFLKENLDRLKTKDDDILISCSEQTNGIGRKGNSWDTFPNSLAMSFTIKPNDKPSLTPIEIGVLAVRFFHKHFNKELFLKWPNDILTSDGKKCGGILCQYIDERTVIVGFGINLGKLNNLEHPEYRHGLGSVDNSLVLSSEEQENISKKLYEEFLSFRYHDVNELIRDFNLHCAHLNKEVFIFEDGKDYIGTFKGLGENGEALVLINSTLHHFLSSSLTIL